MFGDLELRREILNSSQIFERENLDVDIKIILAGNSENSRMPF